MDYTKETPQERNVNSIVNEAAKQTKAREEAIKNIPADKGPEPSHPGSGILKGQPPGNKNLTEMRLKSEIGHIREGALNDTARAIEGAPIKTQAKAYKIADDFAYPATARQNDPALKRGEQKGMDETQGSAMHPMGHTDMKERGKKEKNISESQDYAMRQMGDKTGSKSDPPTQTQRSQSETAKTPQRFSS